MHSISQKLSGVLKEFQILNRLSVVSGKESIIQQKSKIEKYLTKIILQLLSMLYILKKERYVLPFFRTKINLNLMKKVWINKDSCWIIMPSEKDNILEFNQYNKLDQMSYIAYADLESLITK